MRRLRDLPKIDKLASHPALEGNSERARTFAARAAVGRLRSDLELQDDPHELAKELLRPSMRRAINLSGVVLHTGLGRARLASGALAGAADHLMVELDEESGRRGDRQEHVRELLRELTGAEDALVVNNAAGALVLALSTLAQGREVVLSRGEMVEIGGSFRIPEIVEESGCYLREVGTTNRTRIRDYAKVVGEKTAALLRCHPSNFKMTGFVESADPVELTKLARQTGVVFIDDIGSGCLVDLAQYGLDPEPTFQASVKAGADITIASGDKLLGGPQAGIIVGHSDLIKRIAAKPLARALRVDKLSLLALQHTLRLYIEGKHGELPLYQSLSKPIDEVRTDAVRLADALGEAASVIESKTEVGGGSAPGQIVPSFAAVMKVDKPDRFAKRLRLAEPALIGRVQDGSIWFDPRTATSAEVAEACAILEVVR